MRKCFGCQVSAQGAAVQVGADAVVQGLGLGQGWPQGAWP